MTKEREQENLINKKILKKAEEELEKIKKELISEERLKKAFDNGGVYDKNLSEQENIARFADIRISFMQANAEVESLIAKKSYLEHRIEELEENIETYEIDEDEEMARDTLTHLNETYGDTWI